MPQNFTQQDVTKYELNAQIIRHNGNTSMNTELSQIDCEAPLTDVAV
jgi:hypothetical protein